MISSSIKLPLSTIRDCLRRGGERGECARSELSDRGGLALPDDSDEGEVDRGDRSSGRW